MTVIDPDKHFEGANLKTVAKLKILEWYLEKYVAIMENWFDRYWYVDTHAGSGRIRCTDGNLVDGSVVRTLDKYADNFERFYLYELDKEHFRALYQTLNQRFGYSFDIVNDELNGHEFTKACCDDPYIRILNLDSNVGVRNLVDTESGRPHLFTFVDPKGLTARRSTLDALIERGTADILINYQTTGILRNAKPGASGTEAVTRTIGDDDWPTDGSEEDYVRCFKERLERNDEWEVRTRNMRDPYDSTYRFDLVFAASNDAALRIMSYIMDERDDLWEKASEEFGQPGFGTFN